MNAPVSRRALLGATAALGTVALPVAASMALAGSVAAVNPDAELLDLLAQHPAALSRWQEAKLVLDELEVVAVAQYPARPAALDYRPGDLGGRGLGLSEAADHADEDGTRVRWYDARGVFWLRHARPLERWSVAAHAMVPDPAAEARRAEILAAADQWRASCEDTERRTGFKAAVEVFDAAMEALDALESRINPLIPRTMGGIVAKASWAMASNCDGLPEMVLEQIAALEVAA